MRHEKIIFLSNVNFFINILINFSIDIISILFAYLVLEKIMNLSNDCLAQ